MHKRPLRLLSAQSSLPAPQLHGRECGDTTYAHRADPKNSRNAAVPLMADPGRTHAFTRKQALGPAPGIRAVSKELAFHAIRHAPLLRAGDWRIQRVSLSCATRNSAKRSRDKAKSLIAGWPT